MSMRIVKPSTPSEKKTSSTMDTLELTQKLVNSWKSPPFQRDLKINAKVLAVAEEIQIAGGVVPGILTIGVLDGETYVVDGQHRLAAWLQTGLPVGYADVRTHFFENMGEMSSEFVRLNSSLVKLRPDDIMRGSEPSSPALQKIRRKCPFIGYDMVRRSDKSPVLSMSVFLRTWVGTQTDVPQQLSGQTSLKQMSDEETVSAIEFITSCYEAWGRDFEYRRLWSAANLITCAWLYRRVVLGEKISSQSRTTKLTKEEFRKCLMALSADGKYLDYLVGRNVSERDRAPIYGRIKTIFQRRYYTETGKKINLPQPAWAHGSSSH